jgi:hypothetical protein
MACLIFPDFFPGSKKTVQTIDVQQILGTLQFARKKKWRKWREKETEAERERGQGIEGRAKHTHATQLATLRNDKHPQDARLGSACVANPEWLENGQSLSPRVNREILLP